ncbi:MAG TPA: ABC transporter permease [Bacillales bacterium]|nr:ABC transporter permease [Bacillales bacterium]
MGNLIRSELFKLRKDRSFWVLSCIILAYALFVPIFQFFDNGPQYSTGIKIYLNALAGNNYITKLVPCILAGFFISSEYSIGTMKSMASTGSSRERIYVAKFIAFTIGAVLLSLLYPVMNGVTASLLFGFGDIPQITEIDFLVQTISLLILYAAAFASIMALFAFILTDSGKTIGLSFLFFLLFDSILQALSARFSIFETVYDYSVFKLFMDISKVNLESGELLKLILVPILTCIGFGILGYLVFRRKEIK